MTYVPEYKYHDLLLSKKKKEKNFGTREKTFSLVDKYGFVHCQKHHSKKKASQRSSVKNKKYLNFVVKSVSCGKLTITMGSNKKHLFCLHK